MAEIKRANLLSVQSPEGDDKAYSKDYFEKHKQRSCAEFDGVRLKFYEQDYPNDYIQTTVFRVEKRRGTNILILRCGPGGRMVNFLEFDSKRLTDEWQEALCRCTGQRYDPNPVLRRFRSEILSKEVRRRRARIRSAFPDLYDDEDASLVSYQNSQESAPPPSAPQIENQAQSSGVSETSYPSETTAGETDDHDSEEAPLSLPRSLRSRDCDISPTLEDLRQLQFQSYSGHIIVSKSLPRCQLRRGDIIVVKNSEGHLMNAHELTEYLQQTIAEETIRVTAIQGVVCRARMEQHGVFINIQGSEILQVDPVDTIMEACRATCRFANDASTSRLIITEINNSTLDTESQPNEVAEKMRVALQEKKLLWIRLYPKSVMEALDDVSEEKK